jgi:hypothetical protein
MKSAESKNQCGETRIENFIKGSDWPNGTAVQVYEI